MGKLICKKIKICKTEGIWLRLVNYGLCISNNKNINLIEICKEINKLYPDIKLQNKKKTLTQSLPLYNHN